MRDVTVLVVDDDPLMLRMLAPRLASLSLRGLRLDVRTAQTPDDALERVSEASAQPLAVLSDFNLKARINGLQLLAEVRALRPDAVRVLFSGYSAEQIGDVSANGAAEAFVEKPMRLDDMIGPLAAIIEARVAG